MKRLTKKNVGTTKYMCSYKSLNDNEIFLTDSIQFVNKLGQLEDIEEEIGIDLITWFKALNGIYYTKNAINWYLDCLKENVIYKAEDEDIHIQLCGNKDKYSATILVYVSQRNAYYSLKIADYGKTWALTKEELEK